MLQVFDFLMIEEELARLNRIGKYKGIESEFLVAHEEVIKNLKEKIEAELEMLNYDFELCLDIAETNILELSEFGAKVIDELEQLLADNMQKELD